MLVRETGQRLNFDGRVYRSHLGGLRNRNDAGLRVMLVADTVIGVADGVKRDLAVLLRQGNQFAARVLLRRSALVRVDVSIVTANHGMERPGKRLQAQDVSPGPVKGEKNCDVRAEMLFKFPDSRTGVGIVAVGD